MASRLLIVACTLAAMALALPRATTVQAVPLRVPLAELPQAIGEWHSGPDLAFDDELIRVLGVDAYVSRRYARRPGEVVELYVGFYESQQQGETIHSPQNCLPGAGWQPVSAGRLALRATGGSGAPAEVNRYMVQKGPYRRLVLYWFEGRGRVVASEYWNKLYLMRDSIWMRRTDEALVRVIAPIESSTPEAEASAEASAVDFVMALRPVLGRHLPE